MTIGDLMRVYDGHVVVQRITQRGTVEVCDTRKTGGDFPFDLAPRKIYYAYIATPEYDTEPALTIQYED